MSELRERLDNVLLGNTTAGIQLITGVPGAGKRQLGRTFAAAARERGNVECEWVDVASVGRDVDLFLTIAQVLVKDSKGRKVADLNAKLAGLGLNLFGIGGQATYDYARHTSAFPRLLADLGRVAREQKAHHSKALVLLIDELHTIRPQAMENLHSLHRGDHGCPIMVVGIGSKHTQQVLARPKDGSSGISRVSPPIVLGVLSEADAREAIRENVATIAGENLSDDCIEKLAAESLGFPQHIHAYVAGAVEVIREQGHWCNDQSLEEALTRGRARRSNYYLSRLGSMGMNDPISAIGRIVMTLHERGTDTMLVDEAVALFNRTKHGGEKVLEAAVAHGVLTQRRDGTVGFDIPSFQTFVLERLRKRNALVGVARRVERPRDSQVKKGLKNPFRPGTAAMPPELTGRRSLLQEVMTLAEPLYLPAHKDDRAPYGDIILSGPQGIGKTVFLRTIESELEGRFQGEYENWRPDGSNRTVLRRTYQSFGTRESAIKTILFTGPAWSNATNARWAPTEFGNHIDFSAPLPLSIQDALVSRLGDGPLVILIDDADGIRPTVAEELLGAGQLLRSQGAPLLLILTGSDGLVAALNQIDDTLIMRNRFIPIGPLDERSARHALARPLISVGARPKDLDILLQEAKGHPYRLQELGDLVVRDLNRRGTITVSVPVATRVQQEFKRLQRTRDGATRTAVESYWARVAAKNGRVKQLESERDRLKERYAELELEKKGLEDSVKEHHRELAEAKEGIRELDATNARLRDSATGRDQLLADTQSKNRRLELTNDELEGTVREHRRRLAGTMWGNRNLKTRNSELKKSAIDLRSLLADARLQNRRLESSNGELDDVVREHRLRLADTVRENRQLKTANTKLKESAAGHDQRLADAESENESLKARNVQLDCSVTEGGQRLAELRSENDDLGIKNGELMTKNALLEASGSADRLRLAAMHSKNDDLTERNATLEGAAAELDATQLENGRLRSSTREIGERLNRQLSFYEEKKREHPIMWRLLFRGTTPEAADESRGAGD